MGDRNLDWVRIGLLCVNPVAIQCQSSDSVMTLISLGRVALESIYDATGTASDWMPRGCELALDWVGVAAD